MAHITDLIPGPGETHVVYGTRRGGKSSFEDWQIRTIQRERPLCMQILVDTKPRFRAEFERSPFNPYGRKSAAYRYKSWMKGPMLPNSVVVDLYSPHPFRGLFRKPGEVAIMQSGEQKDWRRMLVLLRAFTLAQIKDRERHVTVDEVLDFYQRNTFGIDSRNDTFYHIARAGGERAIGETLCSQRVRGLPIMVRNMATRVTLFHLREDNDMKYLAENGIPDVTSPEGNYIFKQWTIEPGGTTSKGFTGRCEYPQSYLDQLSAS